MRYKLPVLSGIIVTLVALGVATFFWYFSSRQQDLPRVVRKIQEVATPTLSPVPTAIPQSYVIPLSTHVFQSFNNCGPATLSMALSYFGISRSQQELGNALRPYQVLGGDNDDKSVTLHEVAQEAEKMGLKAYLRPNGTPEKLEQFIALGIPVVTRTWLEENEDIGHYRVVRGYDKNSLELIQDDSLQGKDLRYSYEDFIKIWQPFNYEYLILVDDARKDEVEAILGEELNEKVAWQNALVRIESEMKDDPGNWHLGFAKSRIYYYLGEYEKSISEYEKVEDKLSFRTLWYQIEPIRAYAELGERDRVFEITDSILNNQNRAFSEAYMIRGELYEKEGNNSAALSEYQKAVLYNRNLEEAVEAVNRLQNS